MYYRRGDVDPNIEMFRLGESFERGDIDDKEYDERMDELMEIANDSSTASRS